MCWKHNYLNWILIIEMMWYFLLDNELNILTPAKLFHTRHHRYIRILHELPSLSPEPLAWIAFVVAWTLKVVHFNACLVFTHSRHLAVRVLCYMKMDERWRAQMLPITCSLLNSVSSKRTSCLRQLSRSVGGNENGPYNWHQPGSIESELQISMIVAFVVR